MIHTSPYPPIETRFAAVPALVRGIAERSPDRPAIVDGQGKAVSYAALAGWMDQAAAELTCRGFGPAASRPPWSARGTG